MTKHESVPFPWKRGLTIALPWTILGALSYLVGLVGVAFEFVAAAFRWIAYHLAWWADKGLGLNPLTMKEMQQEEAEEELVEILQALSKALREEKGKDKE